ncbi:MAG: cell division protein SepF [Lachnospiraceae bacterium]|nr:cell division protein SepF [Lachnospiraceae bacterium]
MSVFDNLLNTVRLNDDYDEDFYDEEDEFREEKKDSKKESKTNSRFSRKIDNDDPDDFDDFDDFTDDEPVKEKKKRFGKEKTKASKQEKTEAPSYSGGRSKITPIKKAGTAVMEVVVIKPTSMEETEEIVDTLRDNCTVVLNLEGHDVETAQRFIDFVSGASYAIDGTLRMISSYIFIITPYGVEITGDIQDIIGEAAPNIRTEF